jgi:hypothetical protein
MCKVVNSGSRIVSTGSTPVKKIDFHAILKYLFTIILLLCAVITGLLLIKYPETRTWGIIIFIGSFLLLYTYVVKRRNTPKKQ